MHFSSCNMSIHQNVCLFDSHMISLYIHIYNTTAKLPMSLLNTCQLPLTSCHKKLAYEKSTYFNRLIKVCQVTTALSKSPK